MTWLWGSGFFYVPSLPQNRRTDISQHSVTTDHGGQNRLPFMPDSGNKLFRSDCRTGAREPHGLNTVGHAARSFPKRDHMGGWEQPCPNPSTDTFYKRRKKE